MTLNNLSTIVPNFVKTVGSVVFDKQIIISYDYIKGDTLEDILNKLSFKEFLNIFIQLLFSLEIAQRQYRFCHYDLHLKNIILKPISKPYRYSIVLDTKRYDIIAEKYIPVIIDFGYSCITVDDNTIGSYDFPQYGMMNFLVPCSDMYKLLFHSYVKSKGDLNRQISSLYLFFGKKDPYKILLSSNEELEIISKTYLKKVTYSLIASFTPFDMIKWTINNYDNIDIRITDRDIYIPMLSRQNIDLTSKSFLMSNYLNKISISEKCIDKKMLDYDNQMMSDYKRIHIPSNMLKKYEKILKTKLGGVVHFKNSFINDLQPYVDLVYIIRETKLENIYKNFLDDFCKSEQYDMYLNLHYIAQKADRWKISLTENNLKP
jgi:hypothetical protein